MFIKIERLLVLFPARHSDFYCDYQLPSKARRKFGDQVLTFNWCCCSVQLASFPVATCRPLTSFAAKRAKLQVVMLLPLETRTVARVNTVILRPKLRHQSSVAPCSTDSRSRT